LCGARRTGRKAMAIE